MERPPSDLPAPTVLKFGGTSVEDAAACARVTGIVRAHGGARPVVVVSALARVTDALLACVREGSLRGFEPHLERHREMAQRLLDAATCAAFLDELRRAREDMAALIERFGRERGALGARLQDEVVAYGERLSGSLLSAALATAGLPARHVDARRCIVTDETPGRAIPDASGTTARTCAELLPLLDGGAIPVLGGFIGASPGGVTTTLGRGGSDYTAALVGAALGAAEIQIWTDVSGVLTADPRVVRGAHTIPSLSYAEAAELAYFGAKVLHPKSIQPAMDRGIPVRICNSRAPDDPGTLVTAAADVWPGTVKSIAHKTGITVLQISSARMLGAYGFLRALFEVFDRHAVPVDVVATSEVSVSLTVDDAARLPAVVAELEALGDVRVERRRAIICIVGEGLRTTPGIAARVFETIRDINVSLISQGASRVNLTFIVDEEHVEDAVARLHTALLERAEPGPGVRARAPVKRGRAGALDPVELARSLIDIPSVSGEEEAVARFLAAHLERLGYHVELLAAPPGRPGLVATTGAPPRLVFSTHLDTVPPHFASSEDDHYVYGRGACDAKGIIAAQLAAAERLRAEGHAEVGLLFVVDEERGSAGARVANTHPLARECRWLIDGEPTENKLAVGSKGSLRVTLRAEGTGGHSAYPERGRSAIHVLLDVLADVRAVAWPRDPYFGETTCNVGVITGGTSANVIAPDARADLHIRLVTDQAPVRELLERAVGSRARIEYLSFTPPVRLTAVPGFEQCVVGYTTDVPHLSSWGTPLLLGPGSIHDAHTARERIAKAELERGVELYVRLGRTLFAGPAPGPAPRGETARAGP
jgi:aspartate kinase